MAGTGDRTVTEAGAPTRFAIESACCRPQKFVCSAGGPEASLEAVAKRAGVGNAYTLPATSRRVRICSKQSIARGAGSSSNWPKNYAMRRAVDALRRWLRSNVEFVATKKGHVRRAGARRFTARRISRRYIRSPDQKPLRLARSRDSGREIRSDISPEDLLRALVGNVLHARPARLAESVMRLGRCLRRWPARADPRPIGLKAVVARRRDREAVIGGVKRQELEIKTQTGRCRFSDRRILELNQLNSRCDNAGLLRRRIRIDDTLGGRPNATERTAPARYRRIHNAPRRNSG